MNSIIYINQNGGGCIFTANGSSNSRGVAILINRNFFCNVRQIRSDNGGRYIAIEIEVNNYVCTVINLYAPNSDSPGFFTNLLQHTEDLNHNRILLGDYNLVLNTALDRKNSSYNHDKAADTLRQLSEELMLSDVWRIQNPDVKRYSWYRKRGKEITASRIDFALISNSILDRVEACMYVNGILTDHSGFYMTVKTCTNERGPGYWKLNTTLLSIIDYCKEMRLKLVEIKEVSELSGANPIETWEKIKTSVKTFSREFSKNLANEKQLIIAQLSERITDLEENLDKLNEESLDILIKSRDDLDVLVSEKARGLIFRSKVNWINEGERNTKYFYNLEKLRAETKTCHSLLNSDGIALTEQKDILNEQESFYRHLYAKGQDSFEIDYEPNKHVFEEHLAAKNQHFSQSEIATAILQLKNGKSPGPDGIGIEFYKVFWPDIKDIFYEMVNFMYEEKKMNPSSMKGIINLIPKPGKDTRFLKNLRPITLLNSDYKVIEKAIANRLIPALDDLISHDQKGFLPNRRITINIRRIFDLIKNTEKSEREYGILSLDFQKAFDQVSMEAILGAMKHYSFADYLVQWIQIMYLGFVANIQNNGHFSNDIDIHRSVHQGGPASCYYFIVVAEILADAIRCNKKIKGISVREIEYILSQYADDMDSAMEAEKETVKELLMTLNWFRMNTGLTVNYEKTTLYRIGSLKDANAEFYTSKGVNWSSIGINVLGVEIRKNEEEVIDLNYSKVTSKIAAIFENWKRRILSLDGKITLINSLIGSLFIYKMSVLPAIPEKLIKNIEKNIETFLWNGSRPKISLKTLQLPYAKGGRNLVNLRIKDISLKIAWVKIVSEDLHVANLAFESLNPYLRDQMWACNLNMNDVQKVIHDPTDTFWKNVLQGWCKFNFRNEITLCQPIWWNSNIRTNNTPFYWQSAHQRGLMEIKQVFDGVNFRGHESVKNEFGLSVMQYNSLKAAIKKAIMVLKPSQEFLNRSVEPKVYSFIDTEKCTKLAYDYFIDLESSNDNSLKRWKERLGSEVEDYLDKSAGRSLTNIPKMRSFQYRLNKRAIITNVDLMHWGKSDSDDCSFCEIKRETLIHLFAECSETQTLWNCIPNIFNDVRKAPMDMSNCAKLFNRISKKQNHVYNTIAIFLKQYVYRQRCLKKRLCVTEFKSYVRSVRNAEKFYAQKKGNLKTHYKKWSVEKGIDSEHIFDAEQYARMYLEET